MTLLEGEAFTKYLINAGYKWSQIIIMPNEDLYDLLEMFWEDRADAEEENEFRIAR